ncbi:MAG: pimeloyl-ACP methyl ester carboxylesterase [Lysobacterales bacterium]|jgi:pimeloyl-ACP methyl ester carboxylesterase
MHPMHICRTRFNKDIVTEFVPPANRSSRKVMIFCSGVPGVPCKDDVLEFWAKKGYWTFFPRYRGTWESGGTFLKDSPEKDILDLIDSLCAGVNFEDYWHHKTYKVNPEFITVVGSSFGGPAAILASRDPRVNKAICVSPVVDWVAENKAEPLDILYKLLKEAYGDAYRLNKSSWNKLAKGHFFNPVHHMSELDGNKIIMLHAEDDDIVKYRPVARFAKKIGCDFISFNKGGHLSSSLLLKDRYFKRIQRFLAK